MNQSSYQLLYRFAVQMNIKNVQLKMTKCAVKKGGIHSLSTKMCR